MRTPSKGQYGDGREATFGTEEWETGAGGQETGGPTPAGLLPCHLLPLQSHTRGSCRPLHPITYYIRYGCSGDFWLLVDHERSCRDRQRTNHQH